MVAAFSHVSCVGEAKGVMHLWGDTKAFKLYEELVSQVKEFSLYKLQTKSVLDEPVIKWAPSALPADG